MTGRGDSDDRSVPVRLSAADAAGFLQVGLPVVLRAMTDGTLPTVRRREAVFVPAREVLLWLGCPEHALPTHLQQFTDTDIGTDIDFEEGDRHADR